MMAAHLHKITAKLPGFSQAAQRAVLDIIHSASKKINQPAAKDDTDKQSPYYQEPKKKRISARISVGTELRAERLSRKLSLEEVADLLRLKTEEIQAIEESDFDALPGKAYAIGFVRSYAQAMGASHGAQAEDFIRRFKTEMTDAEELKFNSITRKDPAGRIPVGLMITGLVTAVLVGQVWRMADQATEAGDDVLSAFQPNLPQAVMPGPGQVVAPGTLPGASTLQDSLTKPAILSVNLPADLPDGIVWGEENHDARLRLKALSDVWLRVEVDTHVLFERVLKAGESYTPPGKGRTRVATRSAGDLEIYVDGSYIRPLGAKGARFAGTSLDADALLKGN